MSHPIRHDWSYLMKSLIVLTALASTATLGWAQEQGRVLSTTQIVQQVPVPQQSCYDETVQVGQRSTGAGAVVGAIAGGAVGNAMGGGAGRAAATAAGIIGGAMLGNQVEGAGQPQYQTVRRCTTVNAYQPQAVGYDVVYEYAGRQYRTRTATPPGDWIALSVQPAANGVYTTQPPVQGVYSTLPSTQTTTVTTYPNNYGGYVTPNYAPVDYVTPMLLGAAVGAGVHYMSRPRYPQPGPGYPHRPGWRR
jgi:uncharacterized protein YcfJ